MTTPISIPPTLGKRIAGLREGRGWKQKELAERAGMSVTFVSEVENDHRTPGGEALLRLAEALGTSLDYLMKGMVESSSNGPDLVLPAELVEAADEGGWPVGEVSVLLKYQSSVLARRTRAGDDGAGRRPTRADWIRMHDRLFKGDPGAEPGS